VAWRVKAGVANPEKTSIPRQQHGKRVSVVTTTQQQELLEVVFSVWSMLSLYKENQLEFLVRKKLKLGGGQAYDLLSD
jgi:hypothetical protein